MALNGSLTVEATRNNQDNIVFSWEVVAQENNASTVRWKMELVSGVEGRIINVAEGSRAWSVTVADQEYSGYNGINIGNNETRLLAEGETVIPHESNDPQVFSFSFSQQILITWGDGTYWDTATGSGTGELDAIMVKFPIKDFINGMIMALCSRGRIPTPKPEPTLYLYGTPSESGNIGLRSGDSVTYYDGAVLPNIDTVWTDKAAYPYAIWSDSGSEAGLHLLRTYEYGSFFGTRSVKVPSRSDTDELCYYLVNGEWAYQDTSAAVMLHFVYKYLKWTSFDLLNEDGTLYQATTCPIPIYKGIVDYNGDIPIYE